MSIKESDLKNIQNMKEKLEYFAQNYPVIGWKFEGTIKELELLILTIQKHYPELSK